jgi:hypothetical protein
MAETLKNAGIALFVIIATKFCEKPIEKWLESSLDRNFETPSSILDLQVSEIYDALKTLRCPEPTTFAFSVPRIELQVPLLERSDSHLFSSWVGSKFLELFLGASGSGKTTAFQHALHDQPLPCVYISFRETQNVWDSLMDQLSVRKGVSCV